MVHTGELAPATREEHVALLVGEHVHHDGTVATARHYQLEVAAEVLDFKFLRERVWELQSAPQFVVQRHHELEAVQPA